jgi:hypothetical protein
MCVSTYDEIGLDLGIGTRVLDLKRDERIVFSNFMWIEAIVGQHTENIFCNLTLFQLP